MDKKHLLLVLGNTIGVIATIIVNALAVILPLNGKSTNELSDALPNLFVPSGITFSIWSVIYIFLIIFMIYQIYGLIAKQKSDLRYLEKIGIWFMVASFANVLWIFLWHYQYVTISLVAMVILLLSLMIMYLKLNIGLSESSNREKLTVNTTVSIYFGWITVATIANVTAVLVNLDVGELVLGEEIWTMIVIVVATIITVLIILQRRDIPYSLVIIWALLGIVIKRLADDPIYGIQTRIATTAAIAIVVVLITLIIKFVPNKRKSVN